MSSKNGLNEDTFDSIHNESSTDTMNMKGMKKSKQSLTVFKSSTNANTCEGTMADHLALQETTAYP